MNISSYSKMIEFTWHSRAIDDTKFVFTSAKPFKENLNPYGFYRLRRAVLNVGTIHTNKINCVFMESKQVISILMNPFLGEAQHKHTHTHTQTIINETRSKWKWRIFNRDFSSSEIIDIIFMRFQFRTKHFHGTYSIIQIIHFGFDKIAAVFFYEFKSLHSIG